MAGMYGVIFTLTFLLGTKCTDLDNDTFVPTKIWQTVKEGQAIPAGLHVRINLETGKKEAKIVDRDQNDQTNKGLLVVENEEGREVEDVSEKFTGSRIIKGVQKALNKIKDEIPQSNADINIGHSTKYKTYEEIKKEFNEAKIGIKTDSEIITGLVNEFKNMTNDSPIESRYISILEDLNYLVHQIDNSLWFIQEGGLQLILMPLIVNQTNIQLRTRSLRILGALAQNNPRAQISVFEGNFGTYLSQILMTSDNTEELSTCLYAFGSLLRKFPHAQKQILSQSGTKALMAVLNRDTELKIKLKVLTFISDLIDEKEHMRLEQSDNEKVKQYNAVLLDVWLKNMKFCDIVIDLVAKNQNQLVVNSHLVDYLVQNLQSTQHICFETWFKNSLLKNSLMSIKERFEGTEEEYLVEIAQKIEELNNTLFKASTRDEL